MEIKTAIQFRNWCKIHLHFPLTSSANGLISTIVASLVMKTLYNLTKVSETESNCSSGIPSSFAMSVA